MAELGKSTRLVIVRNSDHGFYLDGGELGDILLPSREVPEDVEQGDEVEVFVSLDSEDRIVATRKMPLCEVDEFAGLVVRDVHPRIGAFLDWGLDKELLLPYREQPQRVSVGQTVVVRPVVDKVSNRIIATARLQKFLQSLRPRLSRGQGVSLLIHEKTPLGYMAIVDQRYRGLLPSQSISRPVRIGETLPGFVAEVKEEGKIDLVLEPPGYGRITGLSGRILETLEESGGALPLGDRSPPEEIRAALGCSKKAFKQALGALYRERRITISDRETRIASPSDASPGDASPGDASPDAFS